MIEKSDLIKWADGIFGGYMPPEKEVIQQLSKEHLRVLKIINEINDIIESNWLVEDMNKQDANRLMGLLHSINEV